MKMLILLCLMTLPSLGQLTKDFKVTEVKPTGIIIQEITTKRGRGQNLWSDRSQSYTIAGSQGPLIEIIKDEKYFISKDNSNIYFKLNYRFNAAFTLIKSFEKDGVKIDLIKVIQYGQYIDNTNKIEPDPFKERNIKSSPKNKKI